MITRIILGDDDRGLYSVIKPRDQIAFQGLAVNGAVREVSDPVTGGDGAWDQTQYADTAGVTLALRVWGQFRGILDELAQYCVPYARPYLQVRDDEWTGDRLLRLRYDSMHADIVTGTGLTRAVGLQWKVPAGVWEAADETEYWVTGAGAGGEGLHLDAASGLHASAANGVVLKASLVPADVLVNVAGTMRPPWKCKLYGPCTGPALYNDSTGEAIVFTSSLSLSAGQYVELDSLARSAYLNSDPAASRLTYLDYANSRWFSLSPGANLIRYAPVSVSPGANADLTFSARWSA